LRDSSAFLATDVLILHLDAEVADEGEISCSKPCPPPSDTTNELRKILLSWAGEEDLPNQTVLCTPSKNTEAWLFTALYPDNNIVRFNKIECRKNPELLLVGKPENLVRKKGRDCKKETVNYQRIEGKLTKLWPVVREKCTEAERFSLDFLALSGT
jgi:hypothetical protein